MNFNYKTKEKIGSTTLYVLDSETGETYSDGDTEEKLLNIFKSKDSEKQVEDILRGDASWAERYHLLPSRGNIVSWYEFKPGSKVLEVGSGCGSITEALVKKDVHVDALEISKRRSLVNAHRNKEAQNLNVLVGNLQDYKPQEKYDYVVCIGVLEYAGTFINHEEPYKYFLQLLKSQLKPGGTLLLAIENRLGLKYLSGAREDHTGGLFDSLNDYPGQKRVQTFGRYELEDLAKNHFSNTWFAYPFPDYKLPQILYSDDYLPGVSTTFPVNLLPTPAPDQERYQIFSEAIAMRSFTANRLYDQFANSFLLIASDKPLNNQVSFSVFQSYRLRPYQLTTQIVKENGELYAEKMATDYSIEHLRKMSTTYLILCNSAAFKNINVAAPTNQDGLTMRFDYIQGKNAESILLDKILSGDEGAATKIVKDFLELIDSLPSEEANPSENNAFRSVFGDAYNKKMVCTNIGLIDINLDNILVDDRGRWNLIDYEWFFDMSIPKEFLVGRFVFWFFVKRYREILGLMADRLKLDKSSQYIFIPSYLKEILGPHISKSALVKVAKTEAAFQFYITGRPMSYESLLTPWRLTINDVDHAFKENNRLIEEYNELSAQLSDVQSELQVIKHSRAYSLSLKLSRIKNRVVRR